MLLHEIEIIDYLKSIGYDHVEGHKYETDMSIVYKKESGYDTNEPHYNFITVSLKDNVVNIYREPVSGGTLCGCNNNIDIEITIIKQNLSAFKNLIKNISILY